jgi:hypothetical protein
VSHSASHSTLGDGFRVAPMRANPIEAPSNRSTF